MATVTEKRHRLPRRISRRTHGILDYVLGALLFISPWVFPFGDQHVGRDLALFFGGLTIFYSLITNYECGVLGLLPFSGHLFFDGIVGIGLLASGWHFYMQGTAALVFFVIGALKLAVLALTERPPEQL
jgi:hypothetical protein